VRRLRTALPSRSPADRVGRRPTCRLRDLRRALHRLPNLRGRLHRGCDPGGALATGDAGATAPRQPQVPCLRGELSFPPNRRGGGPGGGPLPDLCRQRPPPKPLPGPGLTAARGSFGPSAAPPRNRIGRRGIRHRLLTHCQPAAATSSRPKGLVTAMDRGPSTDLQPHRPSAAIPLLTHCHPCQWAESAGFHATVPPPSCQIGRHVWKRSPLAGASQRPSPWPQASIPHSFSTDYSFIPSITLGFSCAFGVLLARHS
jgi:hypothetical protein